jgi:hypothetical protein
MVTSSSDGDGDADPIGSGAAPTKVWFIPKGGPKKFSYKTRK